MTFYDAANYGSVLLVFAYNLGILEAHQQLPYGRLRVWAEKRRNKGKCDIFSLDNFWVVISILLVSAVQYAPAALLGRPFGRLVGTGSNYFALLYLAPVLLLLYSWIMGIEPLRQMDIVTPAFPLALTLAKLGCYAGGCCGGIACEFGRINPVTGIREFPVQLLEAGVALVLFVGFEMNGKKLKYGTAFPVYLGLYSVIRFFTEFLRTGEKIIWILNTYQILSLIGIALGIVEYCLAASYGDRIRLQFQHKQQASNGKETS